MPSGVIHWGVAARHAKWTTGTPEAPGARSFYVCLHEKKRQAKIICQNHKA